MIKSEEYDRLVYCLLGNAKYWFWNNTFYDFDKKVNELINSYIVDCKILEKYSVYE